MDDGGREGRGPHRRSCRCMWIGDGGREGQTATEGHEPIRAAAAAAAAPRPLLLLLQTVVAAAATRRVPVTLLLINAGV